MLSSHLLLSLILSTLLTPLALAAPTPSSSAIEGLTQAGYKASWLIDSQNYTAFGEVFTQDVVYDSTDLGPYGGKSTGLAQTKAAIQAAGKGARTSHLVTNLLVTEMVSPKKARVNT